jgi:hypothetical protein
MMMKKLLVLFLVLGMASIANAGFSISFNGQTDVPDTEAVVIESEFATIDITGSGNQTGAVSMWLLIQGQGSIDASAPSYLWNESTVGNMADPPLSEYITALADLGYPGVVDIIEIDILDTVEPFDPPNGLLVDGLIFHCEYPEGDVILTLMDLDLNVFDTLTIHQVPEPMTVALLGLGGLFLLRRRR